LQLLAAASDPVRGLGVLGAYETQAAAIAATKAAGLRRHYIDGAGVAFWDVHADLEADHADWTASALAAAASPAQVTRAAADGARAWWQFLDERQTAA
jgi:pyrroloquinoline quinone (PQQ) biosynthesis protein C